MGLLCLSDIDALMILNWPSLGLSLPLPPSTALAEGCIKYQLPKTGVELQSSVRPRLCLENFISAQSPWDAVTGRLSLWQDSERVKIVSLLLSTSPPGRTEKTQGCPT